MTEASQKSAPGVSSPNLANAHKNLPEAAQRTLPDRPQEGAKVIQLAEARREKGLPNPLDVALSGLSLSERAHEFGVVTRASDPDLIERIKLALSDPHFAQGGDNRGDEFAQIELACKRVCKWRKIENFKVFYNMSLILNCVEIEAVYPISETPPPSEPYQAHRGNYPSAYQQLEDRKSRLRSGPLRAGLGLIAALLAVGFIWSLLSSLVQREMRTVPPTHSPEETRIPGDDRKLSPSLRAIIHAGPTTAAHVASRTWVSIIGDDANPCSQTSPCKTFAEAILKTAPGGQIDCLDPGGFGMLNITKSITIDCPGGSSSTLSGAGIVINSDNATAQRVHLRGFFLTDAAGTGLNGIQIIGKATSDTVIVLEDMVINGFAQCGISDVRAGGGRLIASNITLTDNGASGIAVVPSGGVPIDASLDNVRILSSAVAGLKINGGSWATINNSFFSKNRIAIDLEGSDTHAVVDQSIIADNRAGVFVSGGTLKLSNSIATDFAGAIHSLTSQLLSANGPEGRMIPLGGPVK
jgi:hypothetical protein